MSPVPTVAQVSGGVPIPPVRLLQVFSPDDWEVFTEEWLSYHKANGLYHAIRRYSGPAKLGLAACFAEIDEDADGDLDAARAKKSSKKKDVEIYTHSDKERVNKTMLERGNYNVGKYLASFNHPRFRIGNVRRTPEVYGKQRLNILLFQREWGQKCH